MRKATDYPKLYIYVFAQSMIFYSTGSIAIPRNITVYEVTVR